MEQRTPQQLFEFAEMIADDIRNELQQDPSPYGPYAGYLNRMLYNTLGMRTPIPTSNCFFRVMRRVERILEEEGIVCTEVRRAGHPANSYCVFEWLPVPEPLESVDLRVRV